MTVNIRSGSYDGPILGTSTTIVPAGLAADYTNPYVVHLDFATPIALTPGSLYYIQVEPNGGFYGIAAAFGNGYAGGDGYQGSFTCCGIDLGFRTYSGGTVTPPTGGPTTTAACKNGGWATFTSPRAFKNQGDCIQFVNTGK